MIDNRNLILAIVLSIAILLGSQLYFDAMRPTNSEQASIKTEELDKSGQRNIPKPSPTPSNSKNVIKSQVPVIPGQPSEMAYSRSESLAKTPRIKINTPRLQGSISLIGGRIDDLTLADYHETLATDSPEIMLLSPKGAKGAYYAEFGWVGAGGIAVPDQNTLWKANRGFLSPEQPVVLTWDNNAGLLFTKTFSIDDNFMFKVVQSVKNSTSREVAVNAYGFISRGGTPKTTGFYILHEGLLGVSQGTLSEIDYDDIKDKGQIKLNGLGGWVGITDKYWLTALVPNQRENLQSRFLHHKHGPEDKFQVDYLGSQKIISEGQTLSETSHFFAGAKEVLLLDAYEKKLGVDRFDLAIDFGWFYFLTKPIFYALLWLNERVLNLGLAIIILTVGIKLALFPLANKSYTSMSKMKKLHPQMTKLRERFGDDKMKLNQEMMALYKKEKVNPASGCLPILVQIPVFFALYKVLFVCIEMRHAPFFGWIQDLSAPDPTSIFNLFGLLPFTPPDFLMIGVWPLIMGLTMWLQQKLNPQPTDPVQAKVFMFLPIIFTFLLATFPAGLVIYWAWNNALSILQQWFIMRRMGIKGKDALK